MREVLTRDGLYPVQDPLPLDVRRQARPPYNSTVRARWTGEKRPPLAGEWYLSGSKIEAYRAPNDLSTPYHIAELVEIEQVERVGRVLTP